MSGMPLNLEPWMVGAADGLFDKQYRFVIALNAFDTYISFSCHRIME